MRRLSYLASRRTETREAARTNRRPVGERARADRIVAAGTVLIQLRAGAAKEASA